MSRRENLEELVPWQSGPGPTDRGGFSIVWSCVAVIITCTWTTLHLNIPARTDSFWTKLLRKIKWMIVMIVLPEFIFSHAMVELKMAIDDYTIMGESWKRYTAAGWCVHPKPRTYTLQNVLSGRWTWYSGPTQSEYGKIVRKAILQDIDNAVVKDDLVDEDLTIDAALLGICEEHRHIKWTITHNYFLNMGGIVNSTNHLPIEPQYIKPIEGTLYDIAGSRQSGLSDIIHDNHITEAELLDKSKADYLVKVLWLIQIFRLVFEICTRATMKLPITPLEITAVSFSSLSLLTVLVQNKKPQDVGQPVVFRDTIGIPVTRPRPVDNSLVAIFFTVQKYHLERLHQYDHRRIPNDNTRLNWGSRNLLLVMLSTSTIVFGSIHCGAWRYAFATPVEKWVWRACTLAGLALPIIVFLLIVILRWIIWDRQREVITSQMILHEWIRNRYQGVDDLEELIRQGRAEEHTRKIVKKAAPLRSPHEDPSGLISEPLAKMDEGNDRHNGEKAIEKARIYDTAGASFQRWELFYVVSQYASFAIYLIARLCLITIAFSSLRLAPRGIYKDTWAAFLPSIR